MKIKEVIEANNFLADLNLNRFDKEMRMAILKNFSSFSRVQRNFDDDIEALRKKMFDNKQDEAMDVQNLRNRAKTIKTADEAIEFNKEAEKHKEFYKLESDFNELYVDAMSKECKCNVLKIDKDKFLDTLAESNVMFTPREIEKIEILFN